MTIDEARKQLTANLSEITDKIERHFITQNRPEGIAGMHDIDGRLLVFREFNDRYLQKFINNYCLPQLTNEQFNVVLAAISGYLKSLYGYARDNSNHAYWVRVNKEICLEFAEELESSTNIEVEYEMVEAKERLHKVNKAFHQMVNVQDRLIFSALSVGKKAKEIASLLYPDSRYDKETENKTNYRIRLVEYRYAAWVIANNIYSDSLALAGLNRYPNQNKRYFGIKKIESIPSKEELIKVARGETVKQANTIQLHLSEIPKPFSKMDFNGKRHDHTVVYQYMNGGLYDHVTKATKLSVVLVGNNDNRAICTGGV